MKNKEYKIVIAGDLLPSGKNIHLFETGDSHQLFGDEICNIFASANYSILNLEGPLTDSNNKGVKTGATIKAPSATINGIKRLGVTSVTLANNHITDYSDQGLFDTIESLEKNNINWVGVGNNKNSIKKYISQRIGDKDFCFYNVSETFFNIPTFNSPGANIYDEYLVCKELKELKKQYDYLIVLYHGGSEFVQYPTIQTRTRFHRMADNGADVIIAQHTHCIGCEEYYNGSYLQYGQGNFSFARQKKRNPQLSLEGLIFEFSFNEGIAKPLSVSKRIVRLSDDDTTRIAKDQNFDAYNERAKKIYDDEFLFSELQRCKVEEHLIKYLTSYKGIEINGKISRVLIKLWPNLYRNYLLKSYSRGTSLRNLIALKSDRVQEDIISIWNYIYNQK